MVNVDIGVVLMKRWLLFTLLLLSPLTRAGDYVIVANASTDFAMADVDAIRDVYLKKRGFSGDVRLVPINLLGDHEVRKYFEDNVLRMSHDELNRYWIKSHFKGVKPPPTQASLESVRRFVERVNGAIGYLPKSMVDDKLKVLYEF